MVFSMVRKRVGKPPRKTVVITFRVSEEIHDRLEGIGWAERDDAGNLLNASSVARRLMNQALEELDKELEKKSNKNK